MKTTIQQIKRRNHTCQNEQSNTNWLFFTCNPHVLSFSFGFSRCAYEDSGNSNTTHASYDVM